MFAANKMLGNLRPGAKKKKKCWEYLRSSVVAFTDIFCLCVRLHLLRPVIKMLKSGMELMYYMPSMREFKNGYHAVKH